MELYSCKMRAGDSEYPADLPINVTVPSSYNELATLISVPGAVLVLDPVPYNYNYEPSMPLCLDYIHFCFAQFLLPWTKE